jgi:tetratricopeptide (TPR) repeat protein
MRFTSSKNLLVLFPLLLSVNLFGCDSASTTKPDATAPEGTKAPETAPPLENKAADTSKPVSTNYTEDGYAAAKAKDFNKSIECFQKAIDARHGPNDDTQAQLHANLAWAYLNAQSWAKAEAEYAKALEIAPEKSPNRKFYERDKAFAHAALTKSAPKPAAKPAAKK